MRREIIYNQNFFLIKNNDQNNVIIIVYWINKTFYNRVLQVASNKLKPYYYVCIVWQNFWPKHKKKLNNLKLEARIYR